MTLGTVQEHSPEVQEQILNTQVDVAYTNAGGSAPVNLPRAFKDAAPPPQNAPVPVSAIKQENDKRETTAQEGLDKVGHSLGVLEKIQKGTLNTEGQKGGSLTGTFARSAALVAASVLMPAIAPMALAADMVNTATAFRPAAESKNTRNTREKDKNADSAFKSIAPVVGTTEHAMRASMNQTSIDRKGAAAFENASKKMSRGAAGIHEDISASAAVASSSLQGVTHLELKNKLEGMQVDYRNSMQNAANISAKLDQRQEKGVAVNAAVVGQLLKTGGSVNASGMAFGKNLSS